MQTHHPIGTRTRRAPSPGLKSQILAVQLTAKLRFANSEASPTRTPHRIVDRVMQTHHPIGTRTRRAPSPGLKSQILAVQLTAKLRFANSEASPTRTPHRIVDRVMQTHYPIGTRTRRAPSPGLKSQILAVQLTAKLRFANSEASPTRTPHRIADRVMQTHYPIGTRTRRAPSPGLKSQILAV